MARPRATPPSLAARVALAGSRFDAETRRRVRRRYLEAIAAWRVPDGYRLPGEFVVAVTGR